jgi:large subunit ribosomal protein L5
MEPRLKQRYRQTIVPKLQKEHGIDNVMAVPRLEKIVLNVGMGQQLEGSKLNPKAKEQVMQDLALITGQKPVIKHAKRSVSNFKLREGFELGAMVTLRGDRMWEFLDRLLNLAIPRIKDFRGLNDKSFDGRGNYSFGIGEQGVFPEVDMTNAQYTHGMHINVVFRGSNDQLSYAILRELGTPFAGAEAVNAQTEAAASA